MPIKPLETRISDAAQQTASSFWNHLHEWWLLWWNTLYLGSAMLVLLCYPSSHFPRTWPVVIQQVYARLRWALVAFVVIVGIASTVLTTIVANTLVSYGLLGLTTPLLIRVLLVEIIPIAASLLVAIKMSIPAGVEVASLRRRQHLTRMAEAGVDALRLEFLPRLLMSVYASIMFAAFGAAAALLSIYIGIYGYTFAGVDGFSQQFARVMTPFYAFIFVSKSIAFGYIVALIPLTTAFTGTRYGLRRDTELATLARMLMLIVLIEVVSLIANYY